jgi:hypothetical protein
VRYPRECATASKGCARCRSSPRRASRSRSARGRPYRHRRRPADAQERERAALDLGLCRRARPRPRLGGRRPARAVAQQVKLSPGVSIAYSGQFEYLERAVERLKLVVPATLLIIFVLLYLTFGASTKRR